jgi:hypothetical protein
MSDITIINGGDRIKESRSDINNNFENLNTDKVETLNDLGVTVPAEDINTKLLTANQKNALGGGGDIGVPSGTNKFVTEDFFATMGGSILESTSPVVETTVTGSGTASTTHALTLPTGVVEGDLIIFLIRASVSVTANSATNSYTIIESSGENIVLAKKATGTDTTTLTLSGSSTIAYIGYRVSNIYDSLSVNNILFKSNITSNTNPPVIEPTSGIRKYLFLYGYFWQNTGTATANPANYTDLLTSVAGSGADTRNVASGRRILRATFEDPGAVSTTGTHTNSNSITLAIRPSAQAFD